MMTIEFGKVAAADRGAPGALADFLSLGLSTGMVDDAAGPGALIARASAGAHTPRAPAGYGWAGLRLPFSCASCPRVMQLRRAC
jgi:hypothetical protein